MLLFPLSSLPGVLKYARSPDRHLLQVPYYVVWLDTNAFADGRKKSLLFLSSQESGKKFDAMSSKISNNSTAKKQVKHGDAINPSSNLPSSSIVNPSNRVNKRKKNDFQQGRRKFEKVCKILNEIICVEIYVYVINLGSIICVETRVCRKVLKSMCLLSFWVLLFVMKY